MLSATVACSAEWTLVKSGILIPNKRCLVDCVLNCWIVCIDSVRRNRVPCWMPQEGKGLNCAHAQVVAQRWHKDFLGYGHWHSKSDIGTFSPVLFLCWWLAADTLRIWWESSLRRHFHTPKQYSDIFDAWGSQKQFDSLRTSTLFIHPQNEQGG